MEKLDACPFLRGTCSAENVKKCDRDWAKACPFLNPYKKRDLKPYITKYMDNYLSIPKAVAIFIAILLLTMLFNT